MKENCCENGRKQGKDAVLRREGEKIRRMGKGKGLEERIG